MALSHLGCCYFVVCWAGFMGIWRWSLTEPTLVRTYRWSIAVLSLSWNYLKINKECYCFLLHLFPFICCNSLTYARVWQCLLLPQSKHAALDNISGCPSQHPLPKYSLSTVSSMNVLWDLRVAQKDLFGSVFPLKDLPALPLWHSVYEQIPGSLAICSSIFFSCLQFCKSREKTWFIFLLYHFCIFISSYISIKLKFNDIVDFISLVYNT